MKKIPTKLAVETKYQHFCSEGLSKYDMTVIERIVLEAPDFNLISEWAFRYRLKKVIEEGVEHYFHVDTKFQVFLSRYGINNSNQTQLSILLCDAIIQQRDLLGMPR